MVLFVDGVHFEQYQYTGILVYLVDQCTT